jgi:hypothetical protein
MQPQPGRVYQRKDLHAYFGGQRQAGIVTPKAHPVILLFSSPKGEAYGYRDGWLPLAVRVSSRFKNQDSQNL